MDETCSLLFGEKGKECCEKIFSLQRRFSHFLEKSALKEFACFLSHCSEKFIENRNTLLLARIFLSLHHLRQKTNNEDVKRLYLRTFKISASVYGIAIALFSLHDSERFHEEHILRAIQNLITGIIPLPQSFLTYKYQSTSLYYLEIKKIRGPGFSKVEREKLKKELFQELSQCIESISHSFLLPGNEEELIKNIRHLSNEIRYVRDLPQVMVTFVEYSQQTLKFLVIALRVLKPLTPSLSNLSAHLPSLVQFSLEKVFCAGRLRNKFPKEAAIFTLEMQCSLFRNHHALNLRAARLYVVKALESMLGPFRDYNGGLLNKENEQLFAIKRLIDSKGISCPFLEDLFYSIKPLEMRALLSVEAGVQLALNFQTILNMPLEQGKKYTHFFFAGKDLHLAFVKTAEKGWKSSLMEVVLGACSQIGCSSLEREGYFYFCFFHQMPANDLLFSILKDKLSKDATLSTGHRKTILNINFQSGDPLSLNPRLAADMPCHILANLLFEGLTQSSSSGVVKPAAAKKIEVSPCGTQYVFHLRQSWWSNGEEVTAYHFEKAWKKALITCNTGYPYPDFFFLIKNVQKAREKLIPLEQVGIKTKDAKTLYVTLESPCAYFLDLLSTPPFFPLLGEGEEPCDFNGPFTVAEWKRNKTLHLSQNPFYHAAHQMKFGGIKISMIRDPLVAYEMFQTGELDFIGDPISPLAPEIIKQDAVQKKLIYKQIARIYWIHCNARAFPLNNKYFRYSLNLALNRKKITENALIHQIPQCSLLPMKYAHAEGNIEGNPELARFYLDKALNEMQCTSSNLPPLNMIHSDLSFEKPLFEELRNQWKEILGIEIVPQPLRWNEFSAAIEKGHFQLCGLYRRDFFNNALFYLSFFKSNSINPHSLENAEYAKLLRRLERESNNEEILKKIEHLLIEESPVIPLVNQKFLALIASNIKGVAWDENGCLDFKEVLIHEKDY